MNAPNKLRSRCILLFAPMVVLSIVTSVPAQTGEQQQTAPNQVQSQVNQADQMLGRLNLTQDQIQKIRTINAELKDERQAANLRVRLAQRALTEAIQSPNPDEALITQRSKEVADAQANTIRLRSLTQVRILQVLTPEQRIRLRMMQNQATMRNERRGDQQLPRLLRRQQNGIQRNSNTNAPMPPRQRRIMRQQPRP